MPFADCCASFVQCFGETVDMKRWVFSAPIEYFQCPADITWSNLRGVSVEYIFLKAIAMRIEIQHMSCCLALFMKKHTFWKGAIFLFNSRKNATKNNVVTKKIIKNIHTTKIWEKTQNFKKCKNRRHQNRCITLCLFVAWYCRKAHFKAKH